MLRATNDATGASKLNASVDVPTIPPTVTCTTRITSYTLPSASHSALARHATLVEELQDVVEHTPDSSCPVAVYSLSPNCSPVTVTDPRPLCGTFSDTNDATGASKLNASVDVPTNPPTVTCTTRITSYTLPSASHSALARHATLVEELHD
jgi:hypothetical protein